MELNILCKIFKKSHTNTKDVIFLSSYWINSTNISKTYNEIDSNYQADVCIIGAGICGLSTAYYLSKARIKSNCC